MVWRVVLVVGLTSGGCGRLGFDPLAAGGDGAPGGDGAAGGDGGPVSLDGPLIDAIGAPVCGDQTCTFAAGETCQSCADCATAAAVCGNGICNESEDSATCFDDCGPAMWSGAWVTFEGQVLAMLNQHRQMVFDCPGMPNLPATQALTLDAGLTALARNMAWDLSHHDYVLPMSGLRCSGQDMFALMQDAGYTGARGYAYDYGTLSPSQVIAAQFTDTVVCPMLKSGTYTLVGVGHAADIGPEYTVVTVH